MKNLRVVKVLSLLSATAFLSCGTVQVYHETDKPLFYSNQNNILSNRPGDSLNVVTFNIKKAEQIELAKTELQEFEKTKNVDVYLLQEMDEKGVEMIARGLCMNYLYIPIVYNSGDKKNIGNAILTRGTIEQPEKLILPHSKWLSKRPRHVTIGEITIHQKKILVYSVHTETVVMSRKKRMDQINTIVEHAKTQLPHYKYVLIGGDFNTLFSKDSRLAVEKFNGNGFNWSTAKAGNTASAFFGLLKPTHDYVFSSGLKVINSFKIETSKSSDHYPVFASFRF
jgi:endonuclease/exonuclease/phosphatase family metal-dependent hydrolase